MPTKPIKDYSINNYAITTSGSVAPNYTIYKYVAPSIAYFGSSSDYLSATVTAFNPRTDAFCIEGWMYLNTTGSYCLFSAGSVGSDLYLHNIGGTLYLGDGVINNIVQSWSPSANTFYHLALDFDGTTYRIYTNGSLLASSTTLLKSVSITNFVVGGRPGYGTTMNGYLDDFRFTRASRYVGATITIPASELPNNTTDDPNFNNVQILIRGDVIVPNPTLFNISHSVGYAPSTISVRDIGIPIYKDIYHGGTTSISGTVKEYGIPEVPVRRRVRLIKDIDGVCIRETWSNPITGYYEFTNLNPDFKYTVLSYDHTHTYNAVVADNQVAT